MARPRTETIDIATPQRVLDAAIIEFATHGFSSTTLADIATRAGLRRSSLLYHFDSKERLHGAVVERTFARLGEALSVPMTAGVPFAEALEALVRTYLTFLSTHPLEARIIAREMLEQEGPGQDLLRLTIAPLLAAVVAFVQTAGHGQLREGLPVAAAVQQVVMDGLMQSATGPLRELLWGLPSADRSWWLCKTLFLKDHPS